VEGDSKKTAIEHMYFYINKLYSIPLAEGRKQATVLKRINESPWVTSSLHGPILSH